MQKKISQADKSVKYLKIIDCKQMFKMHYDLKCV